MIMDFQTKGLSIMQMNILVDQEFNFIWDDIHGFLSLLLLHVFWMKKLYTFFL
jgi:hypothetical protein